MNNNGGHPPNDEDNRDRVCFIEYFSWGACLTSIWHYNGRLDTYVIGEAV